MIKGVIFDFNGVIVDDYPLQKEAWNIISKRLRKIEVTDDEMINQIRGVRTPDTVRRMSGNKLSDEEVQTVSDEKDEIIQNLLKTSPLFRLNTGLEVFLNELKEKNILITIATSQSFNNLMLSFKRLKLGNWFEIEKVLYNNGKYPGKPAPDAYLLAAQKLNLTPSDCLVFEDAVNGIESAYKAGVRAIIAVGTDDRLEVLLKKSGVIRGIHNFSEITLQEILSY